jgi:hypothetical protein
MVYEIIGQCKHLECGHFVHHEKPEIIAGEIKKFLAEIHENHTF